MEKLMLFTAPPLPPAYTHQTPPAPPLHVSTAALCLIPQTLKPQAPTRRKLLFLAEFAHIQRKTKDKWTSILQSCADMLLPDTMVHLFVKKRFADLTRRARSKLIPLSRPAEKGSSFSSTSPP
eukprot:746284-Hanusia_phi.AAC.1